MRRIDINFRTSMVRYITLILGITFAFVLVACDATSNPSEVNPSESPSVTTGATSEATTATGTESTGNPATTDEPIITADPTGTAQTAEPTLEPTKEPTTAPTTAPTSKPTENVQPTADPAIYNDNWGYSDYNNTIRTNGQEFFWTKTRNLVKIPKELQNLGFGMIDPENEQGLIATGFIDEGTLTYYALRDGVFYKLNQGKIIDKCFNGYDAFGWVEEDGTACTIGERSKYWNEVYIEGTNCKGIAYRIGGKLVVISQSGEVMDVNKEDILRETTIIK